MLTFDTSGIELFVTENNPKILNALIKKLKAFYKDKLNIDPYKMAYGLIPPQTVSCPDAKQMYINGHFYYADKFAVLTNGLGIVRHIVFLDLLGKKVKRMRHKLLAHTRTIICTAKLIHYPPYNCLPYVPYVPFLSARSYTL